MKPEVAVFLVCGMQRGTAEKNVGLTPDITLGLSPHIALHTPAEPM